MLIFFLFLGASYAQCSLQTSIPKAISTIETKQIPQLIQKGIGCVTLVELWAGWCGTCRTVQPKLHAILKKSPFVAHVSISADYTQGALTQYLKKRSYTESGHYRLSSWTIDTLTKSFSEVHAHFQGAIPLILLFDRQGKLLYEATEPSDLSLLESIIQKQTPTE